MTDDLQTLMAGMVRPLEWGWENPYRVARVLKGHYAIEHVVETGFYELRGSFTFGNFPTLEAARAAAQADYTARIASALNTDAVLALVAAAYEGANINSVCLAYRHDYGLMTPNQQESLRLEAEEWRRAWSKETTHATAALARMLADARADEREKAALVAIRETEAEGQRNIKDQWRAEIGAEIADAIRAMKGTQP